MSDHTTEKAGGIGFCGLLTVLFIGLKLTHVIDWSWWWVLAPAWGLPAAYIGVLLVFASIWGLCHFAIAVIDDRRRR